VACEISACPILPMPDCHQARWQSGEASRDAPDEMAFLQDGPARRRQEAATYRLKYEAPRIGDRHTLTDVNSSLAPPS
jgi:hypothetical protein